MFETLARTAFFVSLISYIVFWLADLAVPGFVSRYFSVHLFLLASILFGMLWSHVLREYEERPWVHVCTATCLGAVGAILVWIASEGSGGYRVLMSAIALIAPFVILKLINDIET